MNGNPRPNLRGSGCDKGSWAKPRPEVEGHGETQLPVYEDHGGTSQRRGEGHEAEQWLAHRLRRSDFRRGILAATRHAVVREPVFVPANDLRGYRNGRAPQPRERTRNAETAIDAFSNNRDAFGRNRSFQFNIFNISTAPIRMRYVATAEFFHKAEFRDDLLGASDEACHLGEKRR